MRAKKQPAKGVIFYVFGLGGTYEKTAKVSDLACDFIKFFRSYIGHDLDILVINPRGVGLSTGRATFSGWERDVYTGLKELQRLGYERILLYGHSMGAWVSRGAVRAIRRENRQLSKMIVEVSDRSFANLAITAYHYMGAYHLGNVAYYFATYAKWNANLAPQDPEDAKIFVIWSSSDECIPEQAALVRQIAKKSLLNEMQIYCLKGTQPHRRPFTSVEKRLLGPRLRSYLFAGR
jgi:hypothetical protein